MSDKSNVDAPVSQAELIRTIVDQIGSIIETAEAATQALEMQPHRGSLFELFVMANGAGLTDEGLEPNLTSDAIAKLLADRWDLRDAAADSFQQQTKMTDASLSKMRLLWSFLRMWMEWCYAWDRWDEFHDGDAV